MSHQASPVERPERARHVLEGSPEGRRSDNKPIGTYIRKMSKNYEYTERLCLHGTRFLYEYINDQFSIGRRPSLHLRIRVYNKRDILLDVLHLSALIM